MLYNFEYAPSFKTQTSPMKLTVARSVPHWSANGEIIHSHTFGLFCPKWDIKIKKFCAHACIDGKNNEHFLF